MVNRNVPALVGVPVMTLPAIASPPGIRPASSEYVYGAVPPAAASGCAYATPTVPDGNGELTARRSPIAPGRYTGMRNVPLTVVVPSVTVTVEAGVNPVTATVEFEKYELPSTVAMVCGELWITPGGHVLVTVGTATFTVRVTTTVRV